MFYRLFILILPLGCQLNETIIYCRSVCLHLSLRGAPNRTILSLRITCVSQPCHLDANTTDSTIFTLKL